MAESNDVGVPVDVHYGILRNWQCRKRDVAADVDSPVVGGSDVDVHYATFRARRSPNLRMNSAHDFSKREFVSLYCPRTLLNSSKLSVFALLTTISPTRPRCRF